MVFNNFPVQPIVTLNGAPYRSRLLVIIAPPGSGKGSLVQNGKILGFTHCEMSKVLCKAADHNPSIRNEMLRANQNGALVPTKPYIVNLAKATIRQHAGEDLYFDGYCRDPEELETLPWVQKCGFRLLMIKYDVHPHICHARMIQRGRPGEATSYFLRQKRLDEHGRALAAYEEVCRRQAADVFDLGDLTGVEKEGRLKKVTDILNAYPQK